MFSWFDYFHVLQNIITGGNNNENKNNPNKHLPNRAPANQNKLKKVPTKKKTWKIREQNS